MGSPLHHSTTHHSGRSSRSPVPTSLASLHGSAAQAERSLSQWRRRSSASPSPSCTCSCSSPSPPPRRATRRTPVRSRRSGGHLTLPAGSWAPGTPPATLAAAPSSASPATPPAALRPSRCRAAGSPAACRLRSPGYGASRGSTCTTTASRAPYRGRLGSCPRSRTCTST